MANPTLQGEFDPPVQSRIIFGRGKVATLKEEISNLGGRRALILSGKSVAEKTSAVKQVAQVLGDSCVGIYTGLSQRAPLALDIPA